MASVLPRRPQHGGEHAHVAPTPAKILRQRLAYIAFAWTRLTRQQRSRGHDHAVGAVPTLRSLLGDERRLHATGLLRTAEPFQRRDLPSFCIDGPRDTGPRCRPVNQHGAGATLA